MEGIHLGARIPLQWRAAQAFPEATLARWNATNIVLLRALAVLDAGHVAHEHGAEQGQDRLEAKLDLLIALFSQLILRHPTTPAEIEVELGNAGLAWHDEAGPEPGAQLALSVYLSPKLPLPLTMPARVAALQPRDHGLLIQAEFMSMPREFQELWEQTLFRMHRREIQARRT